MESTMQKATATYVAPFGDSKVVEMGGVTFFDGQTVEINSEDHPHLMQKLQGNAHFDVVMGEDDEQETQPAAKKRGRPSAADRAAAQEAAEAAERDANAAADKAKAAKEDLDATEKAANAPEDGGRPAPEKRRDVKAGITEAVDHDFEKDRRNNIGADSRKAAQSSGRPQPTPRKGEGKSGVAGSTGTSPKPAGQE
jgi:hypothetical protein